MKNYLLLITILLSSFSLFGQDLAENQFEGYIIKDGERIEGIVEIDNVNQPWSFQEAIRFFDQSLLSDEKLKKKDKPQFKPGEITEYGIMGKRFVLVEYFNTNGADNSGGVTQAFTALKAVTNQKSFAEVYHEGTVSLYRYYNSPPDFYVSSGDAQIQAMDNYIEECKTQYDILIAKDGEKAKQFDKVSIKKFFSDCKFVVKKYKDKKYTKKPVRGLRSAIASATLLGEPLANAAMEMVKDYEAKCVK